MAFRDRFLGDPARPDGARRGLRLGSEGHRALCLRWLAEEGADEEILRSGLRETSPALRRAAAMGMANRGMRLELEAAFRAESTEEGMLVLATALARCGAPVGSLEQHLEAFHRRRLCTFGGWVEPAAASRRDSPVERFRRTVGNRRELLGLRRAALQKEWEGERGRQNILDLALLRHPEDFERLQGLFRSSGRRGEHAIHVALGLHGDPRAAPLLKKALFATDVDPGRGFAQRRLAAIALGRLGLQEATPWLLQALEYEALDYEGRPGAGLGIQYPVRTDILEALGELQDPRAVPVLLSYLGNVYGSAFGGFYLAAMDALRRYGRVVVPALRAHVRGAPEVDAANGVGVLAALGEELGTYRRDPRRMVREVAERAS